MKKLYSLIMSLACLLMCGTSVWAQESDYDVDCTFNSTTLSDYFKTWDGVITTATDQTSIKSTTSNGSTYYYVELSSSPSNAGSKYVEVSATSEIESVEFLLTGNGSNKSLTPPILGWDNEVNNTEADLAIVHDAVTSANKGLTNAQWFTYDLSAANIKIVRLYRQVKGVTVDGVKEDRGTGNTIYVYGIRVKLKELREEVSRSTDITGVTINGEAISSDNLSTLTSTKSLSLDNTYISAPAVVFNTTTTITYDNGDPVVKEGTVDATVVEGSGNTFVATATVDEVEYTITVKKNVAAALEVSPASVILISTKMGTATATITVTGANLTGEAVAITLPTVDGLTCDKESLTITDGAVNETITLSYQSSEDVAEATVNVSLSDGTTSATVAVTYSSTAAVTSIESISGVKSWTWSKNGVTNDIAGDNVEGETEYFVNKEGWPTDFGQEYLKGRAQYLYRKDGYFQGHNIAFHTTVPGVVTVKFSNTNTVAKNGLRTLRLNDVDTEFAATEGATAVTATLYVEAGEVKLSGWQTTTGTNSTTADIENMLRIYSIEFTPAEKIAFSDDDLYSYCPSYDVTIPENANVYAITSGDATSGSLTLVKQDAGSKLKAGEGVFLCGTEGETAVFTATTGAANISGNIIKGVTTDGGEEFAANAIYILGADNKLHLNNAGTLAKGKAYIPETAVTRSASAPAIRLSFGDDTTGINGLTIEQSAIDNCIYNLSGQKVSENYKGIVIKNGKKVLVK